MSNPVEEKAKEIITTMKNEIKDGQFIPEENVLPEEFFYSYAYPRLFGQIDDPVFIAKYMNSFGAHRAVNLTDNNQNITGVVPPISLKGVAKMDGSFQHMGEDYQNANSRVAGLGDLKVSPKLENVEITIEPGNENNWDDIHREFLKRTSSISPLTDESIAESAEDLMLWE